MDQRQRNVAKLGRAGSPLDRAVRARRAVDTDDGSRTASGSGGIGHRWEDRRALDADRFFGAAKRLASAGSCDAGVFSVGITLDGYPIVDASLIGGRQILQTTIIFGNPASIWPEKDKTPTEYPDY